jgi:SAM-dependent methyltransferase
MYCPCCETESPSFLPFGVRPRPNARCPKCGALERHRLLWLYLRNQPGRLWPGMRLLHVAPEPVLRRLFETVPGIAYVAADLHAAHGVRLDITALPMGDASVDAIVCNHVLEHVPDDRRAMREFRRVLRPGGWAILQSPIDGRRAETYEDARVTSPAERERVFGQFDHVRVYGRDYGRRLEDAGFVVDAIDALESLEAELVVRQGLRPERVYLCQAS